MKSQIQSQPTQARPLLSSSAVDYLFHHVLDGFRSSHEGLVDIRKKGFLTDSEMVELLTKNSERLIQRIIDFKLVQRVVCVFFACLFGYMQLNCEDLEMRRGRGGRGGRRRQETEVKA